MKREDKLFIFCLVMIIILAAFRAHMYCDCMEQKEETNRIVKELQKKTTEVDNIDIR